MSWYWLNLLPAEYGCYFSLGFVKSKFFNIKETDVSISHLFGPIPTHLQNSDGHVYWDNDPVPSFHTDRNQVQVILILRKGLIGAIQELLVTVERGPWSLCLVQIHHQSSDRKEAASAPMASSAHYFSREWSRKIQFITTYWEKSNSFQ